MNSRPKLWPVSLSAIALCLFLGLRVAEAQAYTAARGYYTVKVEGTENGAASCRTFLGIQLLPIEKFVGNVSSVSGRTLSFSNLSPTNVEDPERNSYVQVLTGAGMGFIADIDAFQTNQILCSTDLGGWISGGNKVLIRPHSNLSDLFGATNRFGLGSGPDAQHSDNVVIWDAATQSERVYYFHDSRGRWEEKDVQADANRVSLRFPYGLYIVRRSPGTIRLALSGVLGSHSVLLPVKTGANVFSLPINLSASLESLIASNGTFPVMKGANASRSDLLTLEEPATGAQRGPFYYLSQPSSEGWREVGQNGSSQSIQPLDFLSTLVLRRDGPPGYVFAKGSLELPTSGPVIPIPPDPEPGEIPLTAEFEMPPSWVSFPPGLTITMQTSIDLQNWNPTPIIDIQGNRLHFPLPSGNSRAFYRLKVEEAF